MRGQGETRFPQLLVYVGYFKKQTKKQQTNTHRERIPHMPAQRKSALTAEQLGKSDLSPKNKEKAVAWSQRANPFQPQSLHLLLEMLPSKAAGYLSYPSTMKLHSKEHEAVPGPFPSCKILLKKRILKL